jgi:hypothetical protein
MLIKQHGFLMFNKKHEHPTQIQQSKKGNPIGKTQKSLKKNSRIQISNFKFSNGR